MISDCFFFAVIVVVVYRSGEQRLIGLGHLGIGALRPNILIAPHAHKGDRVKGKFLAAGILCSHIIIGPAHFFYRAQKRFVLFACAFYPFRNALAPIFQLNFLPPGILRQLFRVAQLWNFGQGKAPEAVLVHKRHRCFHMVQIMLGIIFNAGDQKGCPLLVIGIFLIVEPILHLNGAGVFIGQAVYHPGFIDLVGLSLYRRSIISAEFGLTAQIAAVFAGIAAEVRITFIRKIPRFFTNIILRISMGMVGRHPDVRIERFPLEGRLSVPVLQLVRQLGHYPDP